MFGCSRSSFWNVAALMLASVVSSAATTVAERGRRSIAESSPM